MNDTTREIGGALGIALLGTLVTINYQSGMSDATESLPPQFAELAEDSIGGAAQVASQLDGAAAGALMDAANSAFIDGTTLAFAAASALGLVMAVVIARFYPADETVPAA